MFLYQGKWLKFRIEESNPRGILNFRADGIKYFGPLHFAYICPTVGQMEGILTSSVIWMYVTVKQKHVIELKLPGRRPFLLRYITLPIWGLIISSNFTLLKLTKIGLACAWKELLEIILITRFWRLIKCLRFDW